LDDSSVTAGNYVGALIVPGGIGTHFEGRGRKWDERLAFPIEAQSLEPSLRLMSFDEDQASSDLVQRPDS
jgi:hypothetical protein